MQLLEFCHHMEVAETIIFHVMTWILEPGIQKRPNQQNILSERLKPFKNLLSPLPSQYVSCPSPLFLSLQWPLFNICGGKNGKNRNEKYYFNILAYFLYAKTSCSSRGEIFIKNIPIIPIHVLLNLGEKGFPPILIS